MQNISNNIAADSGFSFPQLEKPQQPNSITIPRADEPVDIFTVLVKLTSLKHM